MRKLAILITSVIIGQGTLALSRTDDKADQILKQMHERARKINSVQASIVQDKYLPDIGQHQKNTGYLYFKPEGPNKDKLRITYRSGNEVTQDVLIDGDKIMLYQPKIKQVIITSRKAQAEQNPEFDFLAAPYGSVAGLKSRYTTAYQGDEKDPKVGPVSSAVIQLTPTGKSSFKTVTFWVDQGTWFPIQYRVAEGTGDVTTLTLSEIKKNGDVPANAFKLDLPKGTKKIER
jgi:outer membrane lipoprotein-sorting protein